MTGPAVTPDPRILANLQRLKDAGAPDDALEAYLAEEARKPAPATPLHREFASGQLAKRMTAANVADQTEADGPGYFGRLASHVLNTAQGIPGMEAVEAGAGALGSTLMGHPMDYTHSLAALRGETGKINGAVGMGEHLAGSLATLPFLPANPVAAGAAIGGADQLLAADPMSLTERGVRTGIGAAAGGLLGKAGDLAVTAGRSLLAKNVATNILDRTAARAASAKALYGKAMEEGAAAKPTKAVLKFVAEPDIAPIIEALQGTRALKGVEPHAPEMLDAVYKALSDQMKAAKKGLAAVEPGKPNLGNAAVKNIGDAQAQFLRAVSAPGSETRVMETAQSPAPSLAEALKAFNERSAEAARRARGGALPNRNPFSSQPVAETVAQRTARESLERRGAESIVSPPLTGSRTMTIETPGMMPTYPVAVKDFADKTAGISAVQRGVDALRVAQRTTLPAGKQMARVTPEAFAKWAETATPNEISAAKEGILGGLKGQPKVMWAKFFGIPVIPHPSRMLKATPGLLRMADPNDVGARLVKYGLLAANATQ